MIGGWPDRFGAHGLDEKDLSNPPGGRPFVGRFTTDWGDFTLPEADRSIRRRPKQKLNWRKLQDLVNLRAREWYAAYDPFLAEWRLNRDYYDGTRGKHWEIRRRPGRDLPWKQRVSPNLCKSKVDQHNAIVLARKVRTRFRPASDDLRDQWATELADRVSESQDRHNNEDALRETAQLYGALFGMAFVKTWLDERGGRMLGLDAEGEPVHERVVRKDVLPPWELCVDPNASYSPHDGGMRNARWAYHRYRLSREALCARLTPEEQTRVVRSEQRGYEEEGHGEFEIRALQDPMGESGMQGTGAESLRLEEYELVEYYQRRDPNIFPLGLYALIVNNSIVGADIAPYADWDETGILDIPVSAYVHTPVPKQFIGTIPMSLLRDLQDIVKRIVSSNLEKGLAAAKLKWMIFGAGEVQGGINDQHGQILRFTNPNARAQVADIKMPDEAAYAPAIIAAAHMDEVMHVYEPARGQEGRDKTLGEANLLVDASDRLVGEVASRLNRAFEHSRRQELLLIKHAYDVPRLIEASGPDDTTIVEAFIGADLEGVSDVEIISDDVLPAGRSARIAAGSSLVQQGLMAPEEFREQIGTTKHSMLGDERRIRGRARTAYTEMLKTGIPRPVHPEERHDIWLDVGHDILESTVYDLASPEGRVAFDMHLLARKAHVQTQMLEAAAMAGVADPKNSAQPGDKPGGASQKSAPSQSSQMAA